ncbi:MAG: hypothetical protein NTZ13_00010 [Candidatus Parcubacteria bacterium]|nr:hypothetical protein [Candidatus Parcubacteria bacterium]
MHTFFKSFASIFLLLGAPFAFAQGDPSSLTPLPEKVIVVATVNVQDIKLLKQDGNVFSLSFNISNREGVQPKVIYAVDLFQKQSDGVFLIDQKIYDNDILSLGNNVTLKKEIIYTAPSFLSGDYFIVVEARNPDGLSFGMVQIKDPIVLKGTNDKIAIDFKECFLTVEGEEGDKHYNLSQGVDISAKETLIAHCLITNTFKTKKTFVPNFQTRYRSPFGKVVSIVDQNAITLEPGQSFDFTAKIPKMTEPQAYDSILTFNNDKKDLFSELTGRTLSSSVIFHYVLRGESATIQNLTIDKDYYAKGDIAKAAFFWSGSADNFPESRFGQAETNKEVSVIFSVADEWGKICAEPITKTLNDKTTGGMEEFSLSIINDCKNPAITAKIVDNAGKVLANNSYDIVSKSVQQNTVRNILIILFILLVAGFVFYFLRKNKRGGLFILFGLMIGTGLFGSAPEAKADTFWLGGSLFTVSLDKSAYNSGETITASGSIIYYWCSNGLGATLLKVNMEGVEQEITRFYGGGGHNYNLTSAGTVSVTAPTVTYPETHTALFSGYLSGNGGWEAGYWNYANISYMIIPVCVPTATMSPDVSTQCNGVSFTQTDGCSATQTAVGTKTDGICGPPLAISLVRTPSGNGDYSPGAAGAGGYASSLTSAIGNPFDYTWGSTNAVSCTLQTDDNPPVPFTLSGTYTGSFSPGKLTATFTCYNYFGVASVPSVVTLTGSSLVKVDGKCGQTGTVNYAFDEADFVGASHLNFRFCENSLSSYVKPAFPEPGRTVTWQCGGIYYGNTSPVCSAHRDCPPGVECTPPTVTLTANPTTVYSGKSSFLSWTSQNTTACAVTSKTDSADYIPWAAIPLSGDRVEAVNLIENTTWMVYCSGPGGDASASVTVTVSPNTVQLPIVTDLAGHSSGISVSPGTSVGFYIKSNADTEGHKVRYLVDWNGDGTADGIVPSSGYATSSIIQETAHTWSTATSTTFKVKTQDESGLTPDTSAWVSYSVNVVSAPTVTLTVVEDPNSVAFGARPHLNWTSTNESTCSKTITVGDADTVWTTTAATDNTSATGLAVGAITKITTYKFTCTNAAGVSSSATATVYINPIVSLTATPTSVVSGGSTKLTWTASNVVDYDCTASGGTWSGDKVASNTTTGNTITGITANTTYSLTCYNAVSMAGSASTSVSVIANTVQSPIITDVDGNTSGVSIAPGTSIGFKIHSNADTEGDLVRYQVDWNNDGVSDGTTPAPVSGVPVYDKANIIQETAHTWLASGGTGTKTFQVRTQDDSGRTPNVSSWVSFSVNVLPNPTVTLTATPASVTTGGHTVLTWSASNAVYPCTSSGGGFGSVTRGTSNSVGINPGNIITDTVYTMECSNTAGVTTSDSVTVTVLPNTVQLPIITDTSGTISCASGFSTPPSNSAGFKIHSNADTEGDLVRYQIDWDGDEVVDGTTPSSGYVTPATIQETAHTWWLSGGLGVKTFKVRTRDDSGRTPSSSAWVPCIMNVVTPVDGLCGTTKNSCVKGTLLDITDSPTNFLWTCNGLYNGDSPTCSLSNGLMGGADATCQLPKSGEPICDLDTLNTCLSGTFTNLADTATLHKWKCTGFGGNTTVLTCTLPKEINGTCGTANGHVFLNSATSYGTYTQCGLGNGVASVTTFPSSRNTLSWSWTCEGSSGGEVSSLCISTRALNTIQPPIVTDLSGHVSPVTVSPGLIGFKIHSNTDMEGDDVHYQVDWNNDRIIDGTTPYPDFIPPATIQETAHTWSTPGQYIFNVRTKDDSNTASTTSAWVPFTVNVSSFIICPETVSLSVGGTGMQAVGYYKAGSTITCNAHSGATDVTMSAVWVSNATSIATVTNTSTDKGWVIGRSGGSATITGTYLGMSDTVSVTVTGVPNPTVSITAKDTSVASSTKPHLNWDSTNATSCTGTITVPSTANDTLFEGTRALDNLSSGGLAVGAITVPTTYKMTCINSIGVSVSDTVIVYVDPAVILTATPVAIDSGSHTMLTWTSTNTTGNCSSSGGWTGSRALNNTAGLNPGTTTANTIYTLACFNTIGVSASDSVTVTIKEDGECGTANTKIYSSTSTAYAPWTQCKTGSPDNAFFPNPGDTAVWTCVSLSGGLGSPLCSATRILDGVCGSANNVPSLLQPSGPTNLCRMGTPSTVIRNDAQGRWEWSCLGSELPAGTDASCSSKKSQITIFPF